MRGKRDTFSLDARVDIASAAHPALRIALIEAA